MKKIAFFILFITFIFTGCNKANYEPVSKTDFYMGTVVTIKIYNKASDEIFNKAFDRIKDLENKFSINIEGTETLSISKNIGSFVKVSDDTFNVIQKGLYYSDLSGGRFDITIGPLVKIWGIGTDNAKIPNKDEIEWAKNLVNYKNVQTDESSKSVKLTGDEMLIDLGGIAKGYAADVLAETLKENGIKSAIINLGGNVYALGKKPDGSKYKIGIQTPFKARGEILGNIEVSDMSVVTSGIYERYFEDNGKTYHHILNPFTGYPVDNDLLSVSIISKKSVDGDALSTTVFSLGLKDGMEFVKKLDGIEAIFVTKDKKIYMTDGIKDNFKLLDNQYSIAN
ncbi:Thiamine biosynthesis lipoprotein ApbE precursor [Caloramator mitchellensis]|uniref:FAD:protein FMN transferase n=1 Tax=Caloramator mitchellensis TaxID=908809 RepID=A0A0R3JT82_CALMK|nr:FAD:protein FMN transferase [Caloramator mitchellensis]KRQ86729.1 Thiamine biosynthesis lipoprotein ApbE precursor [Caloramator mitchellensis]